MLGRYLLFFIYWISVCFHPKCRAFQTDTRGSSNWFGRGCPPHATGQFPFEDDCKKFYNCFKGRGQLSICAPGTLFNPSTLECDFPNKVTCLRSAGKAPHTSRLIDDTSYDHRHHHQHFHHDPQYHGQGYYSQRSPHWSGQGYHNHHYHNLQQTHMHSQQPTSTYPQQKGHYIYDTKTIKNVGTVTAGSSHSGVQPPGMLPPMPARELLPPQYGQYPSSPVFPQNPSPEQAGGFYTSSRSNPSPPQQVFFTNAQSSFPQNDFDKKFQTVVPQPSVVYNSNNDPLPSNGGRVKFPEPQFTYGRNPYYPPQPPTNYYPNAGGGYDSRYDPQVSSPGQTPVVVDNEDHSQGGIIPPAGSQNGPTYPYNSEVDTNVEQTNPVYTEVSQAGGSSNSQANGKDECPKDYQGLMPHSDCTKFISCANGRTFIMDCGPGTRFHPDIHNCVHPHQVKCNNDTGESNKDLGAQASHNVESTVKVKVSEIEQETTTVQQVTTEQVTEEAEINHNAKEEYEVGLTYKGLKKPIISKQTITVTSTVSDRSSTDSQHVFRPVPVNITSATPAFQAPKAKFISKRNSTVDRQILRLRGSPSLFEGFVEMQLSAGSWGMVCDKPFKWRSEEAHVICRTLGYPRGAELTWQGLPAEVGNITSEVLAADEVVCTGDEESILECTLSVGKDCQPTQHGIWVRCYGHGQSKCHPGEMSLGEKCYSLVVPSEETPTENLVGFTQGEALAHCQKKGGYLLDITSQLENDFVSEWLLRQNVDGNIMTSGVGMPLMGGTIWIWEGSESTFTYHNWWPGWTGVKSIPPLTKSRAQCIVLRRHFPCQESKEGEDKLCDAQYYFWDLEDCDSMSTSLPYVCERSANKIGCVMGTGASYKGGANVTKTGKTCLDWESKEVLPELKYKISESDRKMSLSGHNYCRNVAGKETHPWCFVRDGDSVKKELCDIPPCSKAIEKSARYFQCPSDHFSCGINGECIPSTRVCDGNFDCSNSNDEIGCTKSPSKEEMDLQSMLTQFTIYENMKLVVMELEVFIETPLMMCAEKCLLRVNCRSFSYFTEQHQCLLSESNIGLSGGLIPSNGWNYYEVQAKSIKCQNSHVCDNGKCIANETVCNGRDDCGDNSDEEDCSWLKMKIQIRLTGGSKPNEGTIEVKAMDKWGLVCDDEFDMKDGDVVCRHLGFPLGVLEIKKHSYFKPNHTASFLIDNLSCKGNETSVADCHHNGWGVHDCRNEEYNSIDFMKCSNKAAGVICKVAKTDCKFNYWQCEESMECIPLGFLCDNVEDCADGSDENVTKCNAPVEVRLVGLGGESRSNKVTEGRVEVRRFGVWGTVCDDDFGAKEAAVVCNSLGFKGSAQAYKEAAYGAGQGVIWLDQVHCLGNETNIVQCMSDAWGQTNCRHNEDVAVSCSPQRLNIPLKETMKKEKEIVEIDQNIGEDEYDIFLSDCGIIMDDFDVISSDFTPRVVSGFETIKGTYPWQATIRVKSVSGKSTHWCGAVVVSRFHVITAGHCLRDYIKSVYFVRAGDYDNEKEEGTEQDLEIDEMWIHSDLDIGVRLNNDIAVVKVKNPGFEFNTWVLPACLPKAKDLQIPHNCTISGWGSSSNPGMGFARILHATWLQPLPKQKCRSPSIYGDSLSEGMFCAGSLEGGPDSCQGDSGGPFLCPVEGQLTLFGVTSWGHGCGRSNSPGVYTNVSYYLDWINDRIKFSMLNHKYI